MKLSVDWLREYIDFKVPVTELADGLTMAGLEVEQILTLTRDDFVKAGGEGAAAGTVFDVKVTPNRGDWLSMIGVAREAVHLVGEKLRMPEPRVDGSEPRSSDLVKIRIDDADLCRRYAGVVVRGVKIEDSPGWMKDRLIAAGMRPINNVVDITNYVMLELGQPLHAFDLNLLHGAQIIVRRARPGEGITSLDGLERKLEPDMLVIADADRAVAIAGVMGGADSEISADTRDILVESANFHPVSIRRTAKRLGMQTESGYRFERGVDPSISCIGALRAAELMRDLAGGRVSAGVVDVYPAPIEPLILDVRPDRVNLMPGTDLTATRMCEYLNSLGIETRVVDDVLKCRVPTFRSDITREIDIVEEVGRVFGYDNLETTLPEGPSQGKDSPTGIFREKLRRTLMSCGAQEALTHSLVDGALARIAGRESQRVIIRNPLSEEWDSMRVALAPNLLQVVARNQAYAAADVNVFEIGKVYFRGTEGETLPGVSGFEWSERGTEIPKHAPPFEGSFLGGTVGEIVEELSVAGAMVGSLWRSSWALPAKALDVDFFMCKGLVESLLDGVGICEAGFEAAENPLLHPTRAARIVAVGRELGIIGEVAPEVADAIGVRGRPCIYELDFQALMETAPAFLSYQELPRFPALNRHVAVVVRDGVGFDDVRRFAREAGSALVEQIDLLDVYRGDQIEADQSSLTVSMVFRSREKTLTDEEVIAVLDKIKEALTRNLGASYR